MSAESLLAIAVVGTVLPFVVIVVRAAQIAGRSVVPQEFRGRLLARQSENLVASSYRERLGPNFAGELQPLVAERARPEKPAAEAPLDVIAEGRPESRVAGRRG